MSPRGATTSIPAALSTALGLALALGSGCGDGGDATRSPRVDASPVEASVALPDAGGEEGDAGMTVTGGLRHPFAAHLTPYAKGTILPSRPRAELDAMTAGFYDAWKAKYLVMGCGAGRYHVDFGGANGVASVSEGQGYGMLVTAIMAGHDPDARTYFDGLYRYYTDHYSSNQPGSRLMGWAQDASCRAVQGNDSATDGDLDIAFGLLLADAQWGSGGSIPYLAAARDILADILRWDVNPTTHLTQLGDWAWSSTDPAFHFGTRPSDFMTDHFTSYQLATGDARFATVRDSVYALVAEVQRSYAPATGLVPDFVIDTDRTPRPAGPSYLEAATDGEYGYNACRVPWHLGTDYVVSGEPRALAALRPINAWVKRATGGDPGRLVDGYRLDGTPTGPGTSNVFVAPLGVAAMCEADNQAWLDAIWNRLASTPAAGQYFEDTLELLALIVMSGNWWSP